MAQKIEKLTSNFKWFLYKIHFILLIFFCTYEYGPLRERKYSLYTYVYLFFTVVLFYLISQNSRKIKINTNYKYIYIYIYSFLIVLMSSFYNGTIFSGLIFVGGQILLFLNILLSNKVFSSTTKDFSVLVAESIISLAILSFVIGLIVIFKGSLSIGSLDILPSGINPMRIVGWYGSSNRIGPVFGASIISILYLFKIYPKTNKKTFLYIKLLISILGIILSGSRGSYISAAVGILFFIDFKTLFGKSFLIKIFKTAFIFVFTSVIIINILSSIGYSDRIITEYLYRPLDVEIETGAKGSRAMIADAVLTYWLTKSDITHLLFGLGRNTVVSKLGSSTHNGFLSILIDDGIIFFSLFLIFLIGIIKLAYKSGDVLHLYLRSLLVMIILKNLTNANWPGVTFLGFIFLFIIFTLTRKKVYYK